MSAKEAEIWASAAPLHEAFSDLCQSLKADPKVQARLIEQRGSNPRGVSSAVRVIYTEVDKINLEKYTLHYLINQLVLENLLAIGVIKSKNGRSKPQYIEATFWVGAEVIVKFDKAINGNEQFIDIRILKRKNGENTDSELIRPDSVQSAYVAELAGPGRPNTINRFKAEVWRAIEQNPDFLIIGNRTSQAREIRARMFGEGARYRDEMEGCNIRMARRWVGEVVTTIRAKPT